MLVNDPASNVLADPSSAASLAREGYTVVDLLRGDDVIQLRDAWSSIESEQVPMWDPTGMSATVRHPGLDRLADQHISPVIERCLRVSGVGPVPFMSSFLVKRPGSNELPAHLDWRLLDEQIHFTYGCWVALDDVDRHNGALGVLPGSHLLVDFDRTPEHPGHDWVEDHLADSPESVLLEVAAGQAVIYDHRLVHYSPPNSSEFVRRACTSGLCDAAHVSRARSQLIDMMARGMAGAGGGPQIPAAHEG